MQHDSKPNSEGGDGEGEASPSASAQGRLGEAYGKVRVWWEPTDDNDREGFAGAYWPAKVLSKNKNKLRVKYDNGEEDDVHLDHVSPIETLPVDFGDEETELQPGEFCEVHNGSKTDPCAWLGRVAKLTKSKVYTVEYPFHNAKPERIEPDKIRRARILEDGEWRLIKPHQTWEAGDVTSPLELELIHEDDLDDYVELGEGQGGSKGSKRGRSTDAESSDEMVVEEEEEEEDEDIDEDDDDEEDGRKKGPKKIRGRGRPLKNPKLEVGALKAAAAPKVAPALAPGSVIPTSALPTPAGCLSLFVTIEPMPGAQSFCFVPVSAGTAVPPTALQVFFPFSAVPQLRDAARAQLKNQSEARPASAAAANSDSGAGAGSTPSGKAPAPGVKGKRSPGTKPQLNSAWLVFVEKNRSSVTAAHPGISAKEVNTLLAKMYQEASAEEKAKCEAEAEACRVLPPAGKPPKPPKGPTLPRTAEQLYTVEFLKALTNATSRTGMVSTQAALKAAAENWAKVEGSVRERYESSAAEDMRRAGMQQYGSGRVPPPGRHNT